ncbi:MAG: putative rhomboid family rane protein, partial [Actinomycetota bacterium]
MSDDASVCYRHPSRESWVLCQRCGKTICGDCQIPAAVGVHCPDCVKEARGDSRVIQGPKLRRTVRSRTAGTIGLLIAIGVVFVLDFVTRNSLTDSLDFYAPDATIEPWRLVTYALVHKGIMHILFNGYSIWVLGSIVERVLGTARFLAVFAVSTVTGALAVSLLAPANPVVGASAGIFGLFAALFIINRGFGGSNVTLLVIVGINLAIGFIVPETSWQAHIGGLIGG